MARLSKQNVDRARQLMALYPEPRSSLIPMLHLAQQQDGWVTDDAMRHIAELLGITPAEVLGTSSFYEMFKREPVGRHLVNVCTNVSCMILGGSELLEHLEQTLDVKAGGTTADGEFTLDEVECIAACDRAPCLLVNYRVFGPLTHDAADTLVNDLRSARLADVVPPHGTTNRVARVAVRSTRASVAAAATAEKMPAEKAPAKNAPAKKRAPRKKP